MVHKYKNLSITRIYYCTCLGICNVTIFTKVIKRTIQLCLWLTVRTEVKLKWKQELLPLLKCSEKTLTHTIAFCNGFCVRLGDHSQKCNILYCNVLYLMSSPRKMAGCSATLDLEHAQPDAHGCAKDQLQWSIEYLCVQLTFL